MILQPKKKKGCLNSEVEGVRVFKNEVEEV